jgi:hypothetical protein
MGRSPARRLLYGVADVGLSLYGDYRAKRAGFLAHERTRIADARMGELVKVVGKLRGNGWEVRGPLTAAACLWYRTEAKKVDAFVEWAGLIPLLGGLLPLSIEFPLLGRLAPGKTVTEEESVDLFVEDESGSALVNARSARFSLVGMRSGWSADSMGTTAGYAGNARRFLERYAVADARDVMYREVVLREGDTVAVLGRLRTELDPTGRGGSRMPPNPGSLRRAGAGPDQRRAGRVLSAGVSDVVTLGSAAVSLSDWNRVLGLIVDVAKTAYHGYPCREGTLLQYPKTSIQRARMGETIKIVGRLRGTGTTFTAPLTGATCIWYRTIAQTWDGFLYSPRRIVEHKWQDLFVEDDSGAALIRMQGAELSLEGMRTPWSYEPPAPWDERAVATTENVRRFLAAHGFELRYHRRSILERLLTEFPKKRGARYREDVLREGDRVAVLGKAVQEPDPTAFASGFRQPAFRVVLGEPPDAVIVSNESGAWS